MLQAKVITDEFKKQANFEVAIASTAKTPSILYFRAYPADLSKAESFHTITEKLKPGIKASPLVGERNGSGVKIYG
ncbi:hypothetical protein NIES4103_32370 [Nostoc sp. NIES-4103]|nr:hypothetical protein NIES4103_32370 [Nostoc sp. NIES-4103]